MFKWTNQIVKPKLFPVDKVNLQNYRSYKTTQKKTTISTTEGHRRTCADQAQDWKRRQRSSLFCVVLLTWLALSFLPLRACLLRVIISAPLYEELVSRKVVNRETLTLKLVTCSRKPRAPGVAPSLGSGCLNSEGPLLSIEHSYLVSVRTCVD